MNIKVKEREALIMELNAEEKKHLDLYYMKDKEIPFDEFCNQEYESRDNGFEIVRQGLPPELEGCGFGDEFFMFEGAEGHPRYQDVNEVWDLFIQWIEKGQRQMLTLQKDEESYEYWIGSQLIDFARKRNVHSMYMIMKRNWEEFRDNYLNREECPKAVMEFVQGIMYEKMTEKQMWGSREDRMTEGRVILFDQSLMPKEGEDTGKLKFEYHPNYVEEMLQGRPEQK